MDTNQQGQPTNDNQPQSRYDWRADRRERLADRRAYRQSNSWIFGIVMIVAGVLIFLSYQTDFEFDNWWALFIMIPALFAFGNAWRAYRAEGRLSSRAWTSLISGIVFTLLSVIFLFTLNWTILGPAILLVAGLGLLLNAIFPK